MAKCHDNRKKRRTRRRKHNKQLMKQYFVSLGAQLAMCGFELLATYSTSRDCILLGVRNGLRAWVEISDPDSYTRGKQPRIGLFIDKQWPPTLP